MHSGYIHTDTLTHTHTYSECMYVCMYVRPYVSVSARALTSPPPRLLLPIALNTL